MGDKQNNSQPAISLPKGGGAIKGIGETFQPNLFSGTGNFSVPIFTSPGRAGFGPQLVLQYSTGSVNGPFGLGWQLSIPRITRKTEKGLPKYTDEDVFVMSGAEDLVVSAQQPTPDSMPGFHITRYRPRTEGLFARIEKWVQEGSEDTHWRVTTKENITSIYGKTEQARISKPKIGPSTSHPQKLAPGFTPASILTRTGCWPKAASLTTTNSLTATAWSMLTRIIKSHLILNCYRLLAVSYGQPLKIIAGQLERNFHDSGL